MTTKLHHVTRHLLEQNLFEISEHKSHFDFCHHPGRRGVLRYQLLYEIVWFSVGKKEQLAHCRAELCFWS